METNAHSIRQLTIGVSAEQARWRPDDNAWSMLEVINHLVDEEVDDFRARLDHILSRSVQRWPEINPEGWVKARHYNERALGESVQNFLREREASLTWLRAVKDPDWDADYRAPWGLIRAGDVFMAWLAHDWLHLRQLLELHYAYQLAHQPYHLAYAGPF